MRRDMCVDCMYKMTSPPMLAIMAGANRSSQAPTSTGSPTARVAISKNPHERLFGRNTKSDLTCATTLELPLGHGSCSAFGITHSLQDRKSTRLNSSHVAISYAVFCLKK